MDINDFIPPAPVTTSTETAARKQATTNNPVDNLSRGLLGVTSVVYETFRHCVAATFFNQQVQDALGLNEVQPVLLNTLDGFSSAPTKANVLRDRVALKPGDGKREPIVLEFYEYVRVPNNVWAMLTTAPGVPAKMAAERVEILDYLTKMEAMGQNGDQQKRLDADREDLEDKLGYAMYAAFLRAYVNVKADEDGPVTTVEFRVSIEMDAGVYPNVIKAEDFSPYLVHLWVNTVLSPKYRGGFVTDPRIAARQSNTMQTRFGALKPKTNAEGYAVYANGMPIKIPVAGEPYLTAFLDKADTCIDESGYYSKAMLVDTHKQNNRVIYVDWLNDIMAYTSNVGTLMMVPLGDVVTLDKATEFSFLNTPLNGGVRNPIIHSIFSALDQSMDVITPEEAAEFAPNDDVRRELDTQKSPGVIRKEAMNTGGVTVGGKGIGITILNFAGQDYGALIANDLSLLVPRLMAYQCYVKAFMKRQAANPEQNLVKIPANMQAQGILWRLVGFEYVCSAIANMTPERAKVLQKEYRDERDRQTSDDSVKTFDVPNIVVGKGFSGFLPHQGRILSSKQKVPTTSIDPVSTGGGKTVLTFMDLLMAYAANPGIRGLITTKGRLVKGTITEINMLSKGLINAIPLRPRILNRLKKASGIDTFAALQRWFKSLPPNTVFINAYSDYTSGVKFYADLETVDNFANMGLHDTQFLMIIKMLGFDMVVGDESHMIKNPEAARSTASYSVFTRADKRRITSGTIVSNTVKDVIGQARAITPAIFGTNVDQFADMYGVSTGLINDDETAEVIVDRIRAFTGYHEATRADWSYMLPVLKDEFDFNAPLTPLQAEYYTICMREAELILLKAAEKKNGTVEGMEADDDEEEADDDDESPDEAAEEAFIAQAKFVLQRVEMFLVSPETDERYINWKVPDAPADHPKPQGADLISPKIAQMDRLIEAHLRTHQGNMATNKIIVFGVNKVASLHFMRHSRYAGNAIHYTAGNEEAVRKFATDPNQFLLVANETALREGENLQMVSKILRQQAVWAPGDHEQAVARMYRPDPRGRYNRDSVQHIWCMTRLPNGEPTVDGIKVGRLASKAVSNARIVYHKNPGWKRISSDFEELNPIKMNPETLFHTRKEDMVPYWDAWDTFTRWEAAENVAAKRRAAEALQRRFPEEDIMDDNGNIVNINRFIELSMYKVESTNNLPGTRRVYCPWMINATPPDPHGYGFEIIGNRTLPVRTVVLCEYGPAIVEKVVEGKGATMYTLLLSTGVKMKIPGAAVAHVPVSADDPDSARRYGAFAAIVKNPTAWANETFFAIESTRPAMAPSAGRPARASMPAPEDIEEITDDDLSDDITGDGDGGLDEVDGGDLEGLGDTDELDGFGEPTTPAAPEEFDQPELDVRPTIVGSMPALVVMEDEPTLARVKGWRRVDPFVTVAFRNWDSIIGFVDAMYNGKNVHLSDDVYDALMAEADQLRSGSRPIITTQIDNSKVRNFFMDQRRKLGLKDNRPVLKPYFLVTEKEVRLAFDKDSHSPGFINYLLNQGRAKHPGVMAVTAQPAMWINIFRNGNEAKQDLMALMQTHRVVQPQQVTEYIADMMREIKELGKPRRTTF